MKSLVYLLVLTQALLVENILGKEIPAVHLIRTIVRDPDGYTLEWDPVTRTDQNDPVIGYKILVWKTPCVTKSILKHEGDQLIRTIKSVRQKFHGQEIPQEKPEKVYIVKADELKFTIPHIDREVWYHIRVLAFTKTAEGLYSDIDQFKIESGDKNDKNNSCEGIISETPVEDTNIQFSHADGTRITTFNNF